MTTRKCEKCGADDAQPGEKYCSRCTVSLWVAEMMAADWMLPCGHSYHAAVYGQDGTAHCGECAKKEKPG